MTKTEITRTQQLPMVEVKLINGIHIRCIEMHVAKWTNLNEMFPELWDLVEFPSVGSVASKMYAYGYMHVCECVFVLFFCSFRYLAVPSGCRLKRTVSGD